MNGISTLSKRPQRASKSLAHSENIAVYDQGSRPSPNTKSAGTLSLDFLTSGTVRNILFRSQSGHAILLEWLKQIKTSSSQQMALMRL